MMLAVVSNPTDDIAFDGALAENREHIAHPTVSLKGPVREKPVIPDGDSYTGQHIAHAQDHQFARSHHPVPKQHDRDDQTHQRQHSPSQIGQLASETHPGAYPMSSASVGRGLGSHRAQATSVGMHALVTWGDGTSWDGTYRQERRHVNCAEPRDRRSAMSFGLSVRPVEASG